MISTNNLEQKPVKPDTPNASKLWLWCVFLVVGLSWGLTGPLAKIALSTGHHPVGITLWNTVLGVLVISTYLFFKSLTLPLSKTHLVFYGACGFLGVAFPHIVSYYAYQELSVGLVMMVMATVPMMTLILALPLGVEKASPRKLFGLGLGVLAMAMLAFPDSSLPDPAHLIWILAPLLAAFSYSGENVVIAKTQPSDLMPVHVLLGLNVAALCMLVPITAISGAWVPLWPFGAAEQAILASSLLHLLAYLGFIWLIQNAGPVFAAQVSYLVIGTAVLLGIILFGERHSVWVWAALVIILVGLGLVNPRHSETVDDQAVTNERRG